MAFITGAGLITIKNTSEDFFFFNGTNPSLTDNYTFNASQISGYSKLDYAIVGGGGGGGGPFTFLIEPYPGGGGGSGDIKASFSYTGTNGTFTYSTISTSDSTINISPAISSINITIGTGGPGGVYSNASPIDGTQGSSTILAIAGTSPQTITVNGGFGGKGGFTTTPPNLSNGCGGGIGFNGGGGGGGRLLGLMTAAADINGIGGTTTGLGTSGASSIYSSVPPYTITAGDGGGPGGIGNGVSISTSPVYGTYDQQGITAGGGGGGGTQVTISGSSTITGGKGSYGTTAVFPYAQNAPPLAPAAIPGLAYTGAGGGGGAISFYISSSGPPPLITSTSEQPGANGGKGYAILWFHN